MNSIYVCFNLISSGSSVKTTDELEKEYQIIYKPLAKFLFSHPQVNFSFQFSGNQILYFKKKRKEFINILNDLINRKQIEIIGDGFYTPILPLIISADRNSQIDMLSSEIRQTFGKRPRGISLYQNIWDVSLISNLQMSGIEYVIIDNSQIDKKTRNQFLPLNISYLGKSIELIPSYTIDFNSSDEIFNCINSNINSIKIDNNKILHISLELTSLDEAKLKNLTEILLNFIDNLNENFNLSTISNYRKNKYTLKNTFISNAGILKNKDLNIYEYLNTDRNSKYLYDRTLFSSFLINQYKHDKMRKKAAREKLWQAQNGFYLLNYDSDEYKRISLRQSAYKTLIEADKILKDDGVFTDSVLSFDYNCDGQKEYVCRMKKFFATIEANTGSISNLEYGKSNCNYLDQFDSYKQSRGLFNDYFVSDDNLNIFIENSSNFPQILNYDEFKFNQIHKDIQFINNYISKKEKINICIKKRYIINSNGVNVQYIVKNTGTDVLDTNLLIESSIINNTLKKTGYKDFLIEVVTNDSKYDYQSDIERLDDIDIIRITDIDNSIIISFETNESCNFILNRNSIYDNQNNILCSEYIPFMYWKINLKPGMETEKNINFTITEELKKNLLKKIN